MWFRVLRFHGRRRRATIRAGAHLFASARREPRAGCARAAGCRDPHLHPAHLQPAHHLASKGARRLARSPASQLALPEPCRSFAGGHAIPIMRPHVHQPYGRYNICKDIATLCRLPDRYLLGVANLGDEEWARSSSFSAPRVGSFDTLFVGGHEAVCAVAIEAPPPTPRPRSRLPHLSDACAHPSAARSRASRVASGRDGRASRVQDVCGGRVDGARRARGRLRPRARRCGRLERPRLDDRPRGPAYGWPPRISHSCDPLLGSRLWKLDYPHGTGDGQLGGRRTGAGRCSRAVGVVFESAASARRVARVVMCVHVCRCL